MNRFLALMILAATVLQGQSPRLLLREGWALEASARVAAQGPVISTPAFRPQGWYRATLPSTVVAALVAARIYPDPGAGANLRTIAGTSYPVASNFSNVPMPPDSPFRGSWWFRKEFKVPSEFNERTLRLHFDGINFRANLWLNGLRVASSEQLAGAWRIFEYEVTRAVRPGATNVLAVEIFPPQPDDLAITFVDWNPLPADKDMGIWRDVWLEAGGPVALRWPHVVSKLGEGRAELTVLAELHNDLDEPVKGILKGRIEALEFSKEVDLRPGEVREVVFDPVVLKDPRLWWPVNTGPQNLYPLNLTFETGGRVSDSAAIRFGVREVSSRIDAAGHRAFRINGRNILVRGAGYTFDMLLRGDPRRQEAELKYVRDMNLNAIRLEGKLEDDAFLNLCDEYGILVLAGWCCCDHWEHWPTWKAEDRIIADESLKDQVRRLRSHASVFNWMNGSDNPPPAEVERGYLNILEGLRWPGAVVSSATAKPAPFSGPSGVKMTGPYEYVAPGYWLGDGGEYGGAHGFNTETSPGPAVPPIESLRRMLPPDHLWPMDAMWDFHAGGGPFKDVKVFAEAQDKRFGPSHSAEEFARKAQVLAYEGHRAMFEAFGRNKYESTGVIQWMLNNAWPSMIWHLYDWYLRPGGSYFGAKKACEPLHIQYSYDDGSVVVVNSRYQAYPGLKVKARVLGLDMTEKFKQEASLDVAEDSSTRAFLVPAIKGLQGPYFLRLDLSDGGGRALSSNFYWLATRMDELDWDASDWYHTPTRTFADFTALQNLPKVQLKVSSRHEASGNEGITRVTLENPSKSLAFAVRLKVDRPNGEEILPVLWEDNYISLLPGEKRELTARYPLDGDVRSVVDVTDGFARTFGAKVRDPQVEVDGWNVVPVRPKIRKEEGD